MFEDHRRDGEVDQNGAPEKQGRRAHTKIVSWAGELDLGSAGRSVAKLGEAARSGGGAELQNGHGRTLISLLAVLPCTCSRISLSASPRPCSHTPPNPCHRGHVITILHLL